MPIIDQQYSRPWKFVDQRERGDAALRSDFDLQLDDMADALNAALSGGLGFVGEWHASTGAFPATRPDGNKIRARDAWKVTGSGEVDGVQVEDGNVLVALVSDPGPAWGNTWLLLAFATTADLEGFVAQITADAASAGTSASEAAASESMAAKWADEDEDVPVAEGPDRFSAKHWAQKAQEVADSVANPAPASRTIATNNGLTGGGDLSADRTLALAGQALALHNLGINGLVARTAADTFSARTITGSGSVNVSNGDGVAENPIISVTALTQEQAEDADSTVQGTVSGQRLAQAIAANAPDAGLNPFGVIAAGDEIRSRLDAEDLRTVGSFATRHHFSFMQPGTIRVTFEHRANLTEFGGTSEAQIMRVRNGSSTQIVLYSTTSLTYVSRSQDVDVLPGDMVQVQHRTLGEGSRIRNVRFQTAGQNLWPGPDDVRLEGNDYGLE